MHVTELGFATLNDVASLALLHSVIAHLLQSSLNLAFELGILSQVNLSESAILDPSALITKSAHAQEGLVACDLVLEGTTNQHRDAVAAGLGPEVDASASVLVIDDVNGIAVAMLHIHLLQHQV